MKSPDKIYLQIGDDVLQEEFDELNTEGITWSAVKIHENDLQFISAEKVVELLGKHRAKFVDIDSLVDANAMVSIKYLANILTDLTALIEGE